MAGYYDAEGNWIDTSGGRTPPPGGVSGRGGHSEYQPPMPPAPVAPTSQPLRRPRTPGLLDVPGEGESWWQANKGRWRQPRRSVEYWQGMQGRRPHATRTSWDYVSGQLQGMRRGSTTARRGADFIRTYKLQQPGLGEDYAKRNVGYFENPGEMENYYRQFSSYFSTPGQGEDWVRKNMGGFEKAGDAETNYGNAQRRIASGAQNTLGYFRDTRPYATGSTAVDSERGYFSPQLRNKSYSEQIYDSGAGGLIDPYQRALDKRTRDIRNAAAARGMFGTGAGLRAEAELGADIAAEEARDRIALADQADTQRLGRARAALDFASEAERALLGRRSFGLDAATAADASTRENVGLETDAARISQQAMIDRLFKGGQLGLQADEVGQGRVRLGMDAADRAQSAGNRRVTSGMDVASRGQELEQDRIRNEVQRILDAAGLDIDADKLDMDVLDRLMKGAGQVDDQYNQDFTTDFNATRALDRDELDWLESEYGGAKDAQGLFEGRERGALQDIERSARDQAGLLTGALGNATEEQKQMAQDVIQTLMAEYGLDAKQAEAMAEKAYQTGQLAMYYKLLKSK